MSSTAADSAEGIDDSRGFAASLDEPLEEEEEQSTAVLLSCSPEQEVAGIGSSFSPAVARVSGELRKEGAKWSWLRVPPGGGELLVVQGRAAARILAQRRQGTAEQRPRNGGDARR